MKKILYSVMAIAALTFSFTSLTSCEDVPAPYEIPGGNDNPDTPSGELKTIFSEDFSKGQGGFTFSNVKLEDGLSYVWKATSYNSSYYLIASAYTNGASHESESWAVSPAINLSDCTTATLSFKHAINKLDDTSKIKDFMTVWASTDYAGNAATATWTKLEVPTYPAGTSWSFVESGDIDLKAFCGKDKVYIGYKYMSENGMSGSWEVNDFKIMGDGTPMADNPDQPTTPDQPGVEATTIFKETCGNADVSSKPYVDKYTGWAKEGTGASDVTYTGTKSSVRSSGLSNLGSYDNASGPNVVFFGTAPSTFIVNKITLTSDQTKLKLCFGGSHSLKEGSSYINTFDTSKFIVSVSADGTNWVDLTYNKNNGDEKNPYWIYATANFTLKKAVSTLYIRFTANVSSAFRLDDILLTTGEGGQEIDL